MSTLRNIAVLLAAFTLLTVSAANATELRAGWNFNDYSAAPDSQMVVSHGAGAMTTNWAAANIANFAGSTINRVGGDVAGRDIAFQNGGTAGSPANEGRWVQFQIDMTGLRDLRLSYAGRTTATGMRNLTWAWSVDGTNFTNFTTVDHVALFGGGTYGLVEIDLSGVAALNNNPTVFIRATFATQPDQSGTMGGGNTRFDNIQFTAAPNTST